MIYVIQTGFNKEEKIQKLIEELIAPDYYKSVFFPINRRLRKHNGKWTNKEEKLYPNYLFVETDTPKELQRELRQIVEFKRIICFGEGEKRNYGFLSAQEEKLLKHLMGEDVEDKKDDKVVDVSLIKIKEGKLVQIVSGPLLGMEGKILKIDLHKKSAKVEVDMFGTKSAVILGIDYINVVDEEKEVK